MRCTLTCAALIPSASERLHPPARGDLPLGAAAPAPLRPLSVASAETRCLHARAVCSTAQHRPRVLRKLRDRTEQLDSTARRFVCRRSTGGDAASHGRRRRFATRCAAHCVTPAILAPLGRAEATWPSPHARAPPHEHPLTPPSAPRALVRSVPCRRMGGARRPRLGAHLLHRPHQQADGVGASGRWRHGRARKWRLLRWATEP